MNTLTACFCCRKKIHKASSVPQRSLPDIPVTEPSGNNDNYSDLYATVADKVEGKPSPAVSLKKETSISQHSSISQADANSPYATVKNSIHGYDKVRKNTDEHPYAQLNDPSTIRTSVNPMKENPYENTDETDDIVLPSINTNQNTSDSSTTDSENSPQEMIPAAAAMLGMISASQELPYMTPPIIPQPNFSGDSQDSSKGYTSISVREPLANIIAQTKRQQRLLGKQKSDSHYATVSDDSDEMYAAIEDPNNRADIYNSGSETYAQIQPTNQLVTVQINNQQQLISVSESFQTISTSTGMTITSKQKLHDDHNQNLMHLKQYQQQSQQICGQYSSSSNQLSNDQTPPPPPVDTLFAMHSRQASSSSNVSYIGNIGSPKPEKRQANSPLPPTPKSDTNSFTNLATNQLTVINSRHANANLGEEEDQPKNIDGMYAKVMKKSKFTGTTSQNNSPILGRRVVGNPPDQNKNNVPGGDSNKLIENARPRSDTYLKTNIIATKPIENRFSEGYSIVHTLFPDVNACGESSEKTNIIIEPGYESLPDTASLSTNDPGYETLLKNANLNIENKQGSKTNSDYDPNYEVLQPFNSNKLLTNSAGDDGYAKVMEKRVIANDDDDLAGYSKVKERVEDDDISAGYTKVKERVIDDDDDILAGYSKVKEKIKEHDDDIADGYSKVKEKNDQDDEDDLNGYSKVKKIIKNEDDDIFIDYSKIKEQKNIQEDDDDTLAGYTKVKERIKHSKEIDDDLLAGYSKIKERKGEIVNCDSDDDDDDDDDDLPGYSSIKKKLENHCYASILEAKNENSISFPSNNNKNNLSSNENSTMFIDNCSNNKFNNNNNELSTNFDSESVLSNNKNVDKTILINLNISSHAKLNEKRNPTDNLNEFNSRITTNVQKTDLPSCESGLDIYNQPSSFSTKSNAKSSDFNVNHSNSLDLKVHVIQKENPYEKIGEKVEIPQNLENCAVTTEKPQTTQENGTVLVVDDYFQV